MGDLLKGFVEWLRELWPFREVQQWERGVWLVGGKYWKTVGPGIYLVVPWFMHIETVNTAPAIIGTGRQDITLSDGRTLSFVATATVRVIDVKKAVCDVEHYTETTQEILGAILAEKLAEVDASRLAPEKRGRLFADLRRWVDAETQQFGVATEKVRFNSFVINIRTYRLLNDISKIAGW